eukprot:5501809-Prymnesium_polylepis.1
MSGPPRVEAAVRAPARLAEVPGGESHRPEYVRTRPINAHAVHDSGEPACRCTRTNHEATGLMMRMGA